MDLDETKPYIRKQWYVCNVIHRCTGSGTHMLCMYVPYTAKLLRGKTVAVGIQMTIYGKTFTVALLPTSQIV